MPNEPNKKLQLILAFGMIYIVWGSTYLAIAFAIETIPPFIAIGSRFALAGSALYAFLRLRGVEAPTMQRRVNASIIGFLTLGLGTGLVAWAEQFITSGLAALIITAVPIWLVLLDWLMLKGGAPNRFVIAGLVLGLAGIIVLVGPEVAKGVNSPNSLAVLAVIGASFTWSLGSLRSKMIEMPTNVFMSSAVQMAAGGVVIFLLGLAFGEGAQFSFEAISMHSFNGWIYLVIFGSFGGFSAYVWLLGNAPPKQIASYAFVNPVVAVFLGWWLAGEVVTDRMLIAIVILVAAVSLIVIYGGNRKVVPLRVRPGQR
ncbi:EamA family transporter [bacterium]|nr:EamA family transporter [bacterium]